jgi:hypothetical protein
VSKRSASDQDPIVDDRIPKQPLSSYVFYLKSRTGIIDGNFAERSRTLSEEWEAMPDHEKQPWKDLANNEQAHYQREMDDIRAEAREYWKANSTLRHGSWLFKGKA